MRHLADHLLAAGRRDQLRGLLLDYRWLRAKLRATDPIALRDDLTRLPEDPDLTILRRALDLSAHILARDKAQLRSQLYGRLLGASSPALRDLLDRLGASRNEGPWLRPLTPTLTRPDSPLEWTLEGHTGYIYALAVTADGQRALSAGDTVRVWDLRTGTPERTLEGHTGGVRALAVTADGQRGRLGRRHGAGLGPADRVPEWTLEGHTHYVNAVAVTADGRRAVSGRRRPNGAGLGPADRHAGADAGGAHGRGPCVGGDGRRPHAPSRPATTGRCGSGTCGPARWQRTLEGHTG